MGRNNSKIGLLALLNKAVGTVLWQPVIGPLMGNRVVSAAVFGFAVTQLTLARLHFPGWSCPFHDFTGIPCPGCGLSRAMVAMLQGNLEAVIRLHLFAPPALIATGLIGIAWMFPNQIRNALAQFIEKIEITTGVTVGLSFALVLYWLFRLVFMREVLFRL